MILTINTDTVSQTANLETCKKAINALGMEHREFSWGKQNKICLNGKMKQLELSDNMSEWMDNEGGAFQAKGFTNAAK